MNWLTLDLPAGWTESLVRSVKVAVVAFVMLQAKELYDAGMLDTPNTALDAGLVAGGIFVLNAFLKLAKA
jgi:hypothetical protein